MSIQPSSNKKHSILMVDPERLVRDVLSRHVNTRTNLNVSARVDNFEQALAELSRNTYDLLLTEIALPGTSGLELIRENSRRKLTARTVVFSRIESLEVIKQSLMAGAHGYVLKTGVEDDLFAALDGAFTDRRFLPPQIAPLLDIPSNFYALDGNTDGLDPLAPLSPREREIFFLLATGLQNSAIAAKLYLSPRTVETHRARIIQKLRLESSGKLIHYAYQNNLIVASQ